MDKQYEVVGIVRGLNKKEMPTTVVHLVGEHDEYLTQKQGQKAFSEYIVKAINVQVGDTVELIYQPGFGGKAVVTDVNVIK